MSALLPFLAMPLPTVSPSNWRPIAAASDHPLATLVRREVGQGVRLIVEQGPRSRAGAERFRLLLESREFGRTALPVVAGLASLRGAPERAWVEVTSFRSRLPLQDEREVEVSEVIAVGVIGALGRAVPPGGSLIVEYESPIGVMTAVALAAGVPPVATPLGGMLFAAGCGSVFRDWATAAGGRAGRRRVQGFRAADSAREHALGLAMLGALEGFMARSKELDWQLQAETRAIAEATITSLRAKLAVPEGPLPPR